jgi:very-short-patch-repair endonuclease
MELFIYDLDELVGVIGTQKISLVVHLKKNYHKNHHYIVTKPQIKKTHRGGGHNKNIYLLTEKCYELLKASYNFRNNYITSVSDNINVVNNLSMCIENQTIGFIQNTFKDIYDSKRQYLIGPYRIDLYFTDLMIAVECDENDHIDRDMNYETIRENYIKSNNIKIIRYNPNEENFDLSNVLRQILLITK